MRESERGFNDPTPVRLNVELTAGQLRALLDDPVMLQPDHPGMFYANTKRAAIKRLADQARDQGVTFA